MGGRVLTSDLANFEGDEEELEGKMESEREEKLFIEWERERERAEAETV